MHIICIGCEWFSCVGFSKELRDKVRGMTQDLRYEISQLEDVSVDVEESGEKEVDLDEVIAERTRQEERSNKAIDR